MLAAVGLVAEPATPARADTTTVSQDSLRTAWDSAEPGLSPDVVSSPAFGQLFSTPVTGQVYAQPLVVGGTVIAATEANNVYGIDGSTGTVSWQKNLGTPWDPATLQCGDLTPQIGITSTPVYDAASDAVYLASKTIDGGDQNNPIWYVHALDPGTGAERAGFPVRLGGYPTNDTAHPFTPLTAAQRPGLVVVGGVVYLGFASYCDRGPYVGYVVGVSTSGHQTTMWSAESGNSFGEAGIWQSGAGLVSDGPNQLIFATGNGISPQPAAGHTPPATLAESVVRLTVGGDGNLTATDFFSPAGNAKLDQDDTDLGAGGPLAIPDGYGTTAHPHLLVEMGKDGNVYLLDRDNLGGMGQGPGGTDAILSVAGPYNGLWGRSAFLGTPSGGYVYNIGNGGYLRAFKISPTAGGGVSLAAVGASPSVFHYATGSPVVTSNGTDGSSALVWVVNSVDGSAGTGSLLQAYRAIPDGTGVLQQVYSAPIGTSVKFSSLATSGGKVYVGTRDGHLLAFGSPTKAALGATGTDLGSAAVGDSGSGTVTLTATRDVTVQSLTVEAPFTLSGPTSFTLTQGTSQAVPVSFSPTAAGVVTGTLTAKTSDGETVKLGVHALGTKEGLGADPAALTFDSIPTGSAQQQVVNVVNTGTSDVTLSGLTPPSNGELTLDTTADDVADHVLAPQTSLAVSVTYSPTTTDAVDDSFTVDSDHGPLTVAVHATALSGAADLEVPATLDFGNVAVGLSRTLTFEIKNTGNIAMTIEKAKAPAGVFSATDQVSEGVTVPAGESLFQNVTFAPTATGAVSGPDWYYLITTSDGSGPHEVMLSGTGVNDPIAVLAAKDAGSYFLPLGMYLSDEYTVGNGTCQNFTYGYACYSPTTGVHEILGGLGKAFNGAGGAGGPLGFPTYDQYPTAGGGWSQIFQNGEIHWSQATGAHTVLAPIVGLYSSTMGETGPLGYPTSEKYPTVGGGWSQIFQNGEIHWSPATGAHSVLAPIVGLYSSTMGETGPLGYPTSEKYPTVGGGWSQIFQNGEIHWSPATGAHSVLAPIVGLYNSMRGESGALGYPTSEKYPTQGGGWTQLFQNGGIHWSTATGAHSVLGPIARAYDATRGESGTLGYPVGEQFCGLRGGGCGQHFQGGSVYWSPASGAHLVTGAIRSFWAARGWETGSLGYPTSDAYPTSSGWRQNFQGGTVLWNSRTGRVALG